jgi:uncharacterized protein YoxC
MNNMLIIFLVILILAASAFCIYAIFYLKKLTEQVEAVRKDIHQVIQRTVPVLDNLEQVTYKANRVATEVESYWNELDLAIRNLRYKVSHLTPLKKFREAESTVSEIIKNISAVSKGLIAFWSKLKHR